MAKGMNPRKGQTRAVYLIIVVLFVAWLIASFWIYGVLFAIVAALLALLDRYEGGRNYAKSMTLDNMLVGYEATCDRTDSEEVDGNK